MSIGGGASSGNSQTTLDPEIKGDWRDLYATAKQTAGQPSPQQGVAPLTDTQRLAQSLVLNNANAGTGTINAAADQAASAGRTDIPALRELSVNRTPVDMAGAAPLTQAAQIDPGSVGKVSADTFPGSNIGAYTSPYKQQVFDTSLNELDTARKRAINGNTDTANAQGGEGAWNGSRAGVSDALTNEAFSKQAAQLAASLNQGGFDTAAGLQQADANRKLAAAQGNQSSDLTLGGENASLRQGAGQFNSNLVNSREVFDATNANEISAANADRNLKAQEDNLQAALSRAGLSMTSAQLLAAIAPTQQNMALTQDQAIGTVGQQQQDQAQKLLDTGYTNQMNTRNLPLQTLESAFGIIPSTGSGSVTHSSGKSGNAGI